jgi:outer membrane protein
MFAGLLTLVVGILANAGMNPLLAQAKFGYVNSNSILEQYKEAQDVRKQLAELNSQWQREAKNLEQEVQTLNDELETQKLMLSEERRQGKIQEIQAKMQEYQQFLQTKWNPQGGEAVRKEVELFQPVYDKINVAITKIGEAEGFDYIFDAAAGSILYASTNQTDLTEKLLEELNKALPKEQTAEGNKK